MTYNAADWEQRPSSSQAEAVSVNSVSGGHLDDGSLAIVFTVETSQGKRASVFAPIEAVERTIAFLRAKERKSNG